ncbi:MULTISPECIES: TetR/AcrR family transcriptional regulator [unclassified Streptomyces]|uniref:TetR/AcrR family transcriptional regulator n=1 Tax=unclassified Streptomyces TaxID=2593676 RepID=UPI002E363CB0|nr:TetR/AcrR family transcriptional regulator [Streptomyces sp. NBC_01268]
MSRRSADERREQLIDAAIRVMIRDGVAKATTRAVVAEAGLPLGAFHYCFRAKEQLLHSVIERIMLRALDPPAAPVPEGLPVDEVVRGTLRAYWERVRRNPDEHLLTYELTQYALRKPGLADVARGQYRHYTEVSLRQLETIARRSGAEWTLPLPVLTRYGLSALDGLTLNWLIDRDDEAASAALDMYADHLVTLLRPVAEPAAAV